MGRRWSPPGAWHTPCRSLSFRQETPAWSAPSFAIPEVYRRSPRSAKLSVGVFAPVPAGALFPGFLLFLLLWDAGVGSFRAPELPFFLPHEPRRLARFAFREG